MFSDASIISPCNLTEMSSGLVSPLTRIVLSILSISPTQSFGTNEIVTVSISFV